MTVFRFASLLAGALCALPLAAQALPPITQNDRIMSELVGGEIGYQLQKHCPDIAPRRLRALSRLNALKRYASQQGYSDADIRALTKDPAARALRDARVEAYLSAQGVTQGDADSYCRVGHQEIKKQSFAGKLLRAR